MGKKLVVADRAKAMVELGDGADLQPRINTSLLQHPRSPPPDISPRNAAPSAPIARVLPGSSLPVLSGT